MELLRLANTLNSTSAPFNQFTLGFKNSFSQTYCSLFKSELDIPKEIKEYSGKGSVFRILKIIRNLLKNKNYDIIHIHSGLMGIIFLLAIFPFKILILKKTIFTLHNSWNVIKTRNQFLNIIIMFFSKKICLCSEASKNSLPFFLYFLLKKKIYVLQNGFDHHRIEKIKSNKKRSCHFNEKSKIKIVCVGALNNTKNQISILKTLKQNPIESEIIFIGDGINKHFLQNFIYEVDESTKINFKGLLPRDLTIEHMLDADISISLSKGEGLPIAVLETLYAGCFQILSNIQPHLEISPPSDRVIFVNHSNIVEIDKSLNFIKNNILSIKANRNFNQRNLIKYFGIDNMLRKYIDVYNTFLKNKVLFVPR